MRVKYGMHCLQISLFLFFVGAVSAQPRQGQRRGPPWAPEDRMHRVEQFKKIRLMEVLKLKDEESIRFFSRYDKFEDELRGLERERNRIIDDLDSLLKQDGKGEAYQKDFDELVALGQKVADARMRFYNEIRGILTPQQVAKVIVFERDFGKELRDIIQDVRRERRRGSGPPYPP
jgi:Spy/CpxP family protein refolding chaperone